MVGDRIEGKVLIDSITYFKDDWGIVKVSPVEMKQGKPKLSNGTFIIKGKMIKPLVDKEYDLIATEVYDPRFHEQYDVISLSSNIYVDENDNGAKRKYLEHLFTDKQVQHMYEALDDPFQVLKDRNYEQLVKVHGCRVATAENWIKRFEDNYIYSRIYTELADCELTPAAVRGLVDHYGSPELVIHKVRENPYSLVEVGGIGFVKADKIALKGGMSETDPKRVAHYIKYVLHESGQIGKSFLDANGQLLPMILEFFGEDLPDEAIMNALKSNVLKDILWFSEDRQYIGLKWYYELEQKLAEEVIRISRANKPIIVSGLNEKIKAIEDRQGWEYTEQQRTAIDTLLANNLVIVEGKAGSGKTSIATAIIDILKKDYQVAITAFAGKAAMRLSEVAGIEGHTIHRLLGYNPRDGFVFNKDNPLPYDVVIVDEISMIGGELFLTLLEAIPTGSKLILLGDTGQLEAIGSCNVAADLIGSGAVPVVTLDKIHRQAAKSAIITESLKIRSGQQIISKDWAGVDIRGEYQDLVVDCYSDLQNTYPIIMDYYKQVYELANHDVSKIQVIVPVKSRGNASVWNLNLALQEYCNPPSEDKNEMEIYYPGALGKKGARGVLREGDKVINTRNNYRTINVYAQETPVFNGNMGIIERIDNINDIAIIDFYGIGRIIFNKSELATVSLGYAITVHKFQGSQTETVIFGIDFSAMTLLTRELVYTGITRAQKRCILVAQNSALRYATSKEAVSEKQTHLRIILQKLLQENI